MAAAASGLSAQSNDLVQVVAVFKLDDNSGQRLPVSAAARSKASVSALARTSAAKLGQTRPPPPTSQKPLAKAAIALSVGKPSSPKPASTNEDDWASF